jgi:hypothetical protein
MATPSEEIKNLKQLAAAAKAEMDRLLGSTQGLDRANAKLLGPYKDQVKILKDINEQVVELLSNQKQSTQAIMQQEARLKGLSGLQSSLVSQDRQRLSLQDKIDGSYKTTHESINSIASLNQELLSLSAEDFITRGKIEESISKQLYDLIGMEGVTDEIVENLDAQFTKAKGISSMTEKQQKFLQKQIAVYDDIKDAIGGILETASLLTSNFTGAMGAAVIGVGYGLEKWGKSVRSFGGYVDSAQISSVALGLVFKDAEEVTKGLSKEFGGLKDVTFATQLNTNLMATNMGISGAEAANVVGNFARMNDGSASTAMDMAATTKAMGKAAGVPIDSLMKDVAGSTKAFAEYGKNGGLNISKAAVAAAKMGVSMDSMTKVTDSLLDFETSINAEMELGAMLGKNLNLDRARGLAYEGDINGAVKSTLDELGGIEAFNKMDIFQKRKAAELLGLSVDEFQKMAANSDKLNDDGTVQLSKFDAIKETLTALATGPAAGFAKTMGSSLIAVGQMGPGLSSLGINMGGVVKSSAQVLKNLLGMVAGPVLKGLKMAGSALADSKVGKGVGGIKDKLMAGVGNKAAGATPSTAATPAGGGADQANKFGKIKSGDLIKGAAALLILAAALYVSAKAFQQFATVKWEDVGKGLVGLVGLAGIAYILSKASGSMIQGAIAIAILGAALIPFAFAMSLIQGLSIDSVLAAAAGLVLFGAAAAGLGLILPFVLAGALGIAVLGAALIVFGTGMNLIGSGFGAISASLPAIMEQISAVSQIDYMPILGLAGALTVLAFALAAVAVSGLLALPVLMALGGLSSLFGGGGEGGGDGKTDSTAQLIEEIKGLRADLNAGKISVNMDGQKVTSKVSAIVDKSSSNSYGKR